MALGKPRADFNGGLRRAVLGKAARSHSAIASLTTKLLCTSTKRKAKKSSNCSDMKGRASIVLVLFHLIENKYFKHVRRLLQGI